MRKPVQLPQLQRVKISGYELYPGPTNGAGLDWSFPDGISLAVGINGLGKTTFVSALLWGILGGKRLPKADQFGLGGGRFELKKAKPDRFFAERVPDRAADATIEIWFKLGKIPVYIERSLANLTLQKMKVDRTTVAKPDEDDYLERMAEHSGLRDEYQFHVVIRALLFFLEERVTLLWDRAAQFEMLRILLLGDELAVKLQTLNAEIFSEDSDLRNIRYVLNKLQEQYGFTDEDTSLDPSDNAAQVEAKLKLLDAQRVASSDRLDDISSEVERKFEALQSAIERRFRLDVAIGEDEARLHQLHNAWLKGITPTTDDTSRLLLAGLLAGTGCAVCGSRAAAIRSRVEHDLANHRCPVCHSEPKDQENPSAAPQKVAPQQLNELIQRLESHREQSAVLTREIGEGSSAYESGKSEVLQLMQKQSVLDREIEQVRGQLPGSDEERDQVRRRILENRDMIAGMRRSLIKKRKRYVELLERATEELAKKTESLQKKFAKYAQQFLREKVELEYRTVLTELGQELSKVPLPSFSVRMTSSVEPDVPAIRNTEENVSESQREFLELAFRMALMDMASDGSHKGLLVMETPEASLDEVFATRAGEMLREFSGMRTRPRRAGAQVFVTCNLNGAPLIKSLLGPRLDRGTLKEQKQRVLNFLEVAAPNAAYREYKGSYDRAFKKATGL